MATNRNITLSLPIKVLRQLKQIAARRHTSLSKLLTQTLEELARHEDDYARARLRHIAWLEHAADLGTRGHITWSRESLHER